MTSLKTFWALIQRDMTVFKGDFLDRIINTITWMSFSTVIFQYILAVKNFPKEYGVFMACGNIIINGFLEIMRNSIVLVGDLQGNQALTYELTLPMPHWLAFSRIAVSNTLQSMAISIIILPLSKILLWNDLHLSLVSWHWFIGVFVAANIFYGFFSLCLASMIKNLYQSSNIWNRIIIPMWWSGCFQFSFAMLYGISPIFAKLTLINPMTYACEGMRSAMLNTKEFIPAYWCILALLGFAALVGYIGTYRMMKRLDCI